MESQKKPYYMHKMPFLNHIKKIAKLKENTYSVFSFIYAALYSLPFKKYLIFKNFPFPN